VLVDHEFVSRIESFFARDAAAYAITRAELEPGCGAEVAECAGGRVIYMGPGMRVNRAIGVGVAEPARTADVDFIVDFYESRALDAEIVLCPYAHDAVRSRATELGFGLDWFRTVYARAIGPGSPRSPRGRSSSRESTRGTSRRGPISGSSSDDADRERRFTRARNAKPGSPSAATSNAPDSRPSTPRPPSGNRCVPDPHVVWVSDASDKWTKSRGRGLPSRGRAASASRACRSARAGARRRSRCCAATCTSPGGSARVP
jgi:hypothetical protein